MYNNAFIGQVVGPFVANKDLMEDEGPIGAFTVQKERPVIYKIGIQADPGTIVRINNEGIKIGKTGIYELDFDTIKIKKIVFPFGANEDTIIDFIYLGTPVLHSQTQLLPSEMAEELPGGVK